MDYEEIIKRMHDGRIYYCNGEKLMNEQLECIERICDYNETRPKEQEKRARLLKEIFPEIGKNCYIEPPLRANWGKTPISATIFTQTST